MSSGFPGAGARHADCAPDFLFALGVHGAPAFVARVLHDGVAGLPVAGHGFQSSVEQTFDAVQAPNAAVLLPVLQARGVLVHVAA